MSPQKSLPINALTWLKANNPLYADVDIIINWIDHSLAHDCDFFDGLVRQSGTNSLDCDTSNHNLMPEDHVQDTAQTSDPRKCVTTHRIHGESNTVVNEHSESIRH